MDDFEKACSLIEDDEDYSSPCDNAIEFLRNAKTATVTFTQPKYMTMIRKLAEKYPDEVTIYSDKNGTLVAHIPVSFVKIRPNKQVSDAQRELARINLNKTQKSRS